VLHRQSSESAEAFYARRLREEIEGGEPELAMLGAFVGKGGVAVDIGANEGVYAYALSEIGADVHAFEANPEFADFASRMLGDRARVHRLALSNETGHASFFVPLADDGSALHLAGNLKNSHRQFDRQTVIKVEVRTLDSFAFSNVQLIKADVEGSELEVLEGARETIGRDHPALLLELLSGTYPDPLAVTREVCERYGYSAFVVDKGKRLDAMTTIAGLGANTTWGSPIATRNVLFL
jgi:FkbM family methyltransferase